MRPLRIPFIRRLKVTRVIRVNVLTDHGLVEILEAQPRRFWHGDIAILDQGIGQASDQVVPLGFVDRVILQDQEVFGCCGTVDAGQCRDR